MDVDSKHIKTIVYDDTDDILYITFHHGGKYKYLKVPQMVYDGLEMSSSKSLYFRHQIKNRYRTEKVRE